MAFIGTWFIAETGIRRHVQRIASVLGRVKAGELDARIGAPYPRGELGELMAVVDRTSSAVETQQAAITSSSEDLRKLNRTLHMIGGINAMIVRVRDRDELYREACRIAVEQGNFAMAWIGSFDPVANDVTPIAWAGLETKEYLDKSGSNARGTLPLGQGSVSRAIRARCSSMTCWPRPGRTTRAGQKGCRGGTARSSRCR